MNNMSPPSIFVRNGLWLLFVNLMQERGKDPPCFPQFVAAGVMSDTVLISLLFKLDPLAPSSEAFAK